MAVKINMFNCGINFFQLNFFINAASIFFLASFG